MRIIRSTLLKIAQDTVAQRTRSDRTINAAYLCGSLLGEDYLLGGATDIDLVFIHIEKPEFAREIVRLTDEVHLDIAHHYRKDYQQTRALRVHRWLGPTLCDCKALYDPQHFLDFTQASVRGQFYQAENVLERSRQGAEHARQIWQGFTLDLPDPGPRELWRYLKALEHATNAVASLNGPPLTDRRMILAYSERAEKVGRPGLPSALAGLLGGAYVDRETLQAMLPGWEETYNAASGAGDPARKGRLSPHRLGYYRRAFQAILQREQPHAVLWPLVRSWTEAALQLPENAPELDAWRDAGEKLGLLGPAFEEKVAALDAYLDQIEETLEAWAYANGAVY